MNNKPLSPRRKSPEKKNVASLQDTLQAAKRTFLTSTETKSPLKRPLTPEPDLEEEIASPASVKSWNCHPLSTQEGKGFLEDPVAEHCGRRRCSCSWEARRSE
jgi:hypothetical protein